MAQLTFQQAQAMYVHRFTVDHVPNWAKTAAPNGKFYAPHYSSDAEWFASTKFPPNNPYALSKRDTSCHSSNQSWPLGQWLDQPFSKAVR
jgi:hypothetical protein